MILTSYVDNVDELAAWDYYEEIGSLSEDLHSFSNRDFTISGFDKLGSQYSIKQVKTQTDYGYNGNVVISKTFDYVVDGLNLKIIWWNKDLVTVGIQKDIFISLTPSQLSKIERGARDRVINKLISDAHSGPMEPILDVLLQRYKSELDLYLLNNSPSLKLAIDSESTEPYLSYLDTILYPPTLEYPQGKKVRDSIVEKL